MYKSNYLHNRTFAALGALLIFLTALSVSAQTSTFSYQGRLTDNSMAANGSYDMQFRIYTAATGGAQQGITVTKIAVPVTNGIFTVQIDPTLAPFVAGDNRFLEISVRFNGSGSGYTTLTPRQLITGVPYSSVGAFAFNAQNAQNADNLGNVPASGYVKTDNPALTDARNPLAGNGSYVQNSTNPQAATNFNISGNGTIGGTLTAANLTGSGAGITNLNGANIAANSIGSSQLNSAARSRFDTSLIALQRWDLLPNYKSISVGDFPQSLIFDGTFIYTANNATNTVTRIRAATGAVEGNPIAVGSNPIAFTFDGTFVYVANSGSDNITRIRASTGVVEGNPIAVGLQPLALVFDGTFVYVANSGSDTITRIRASTGIVEGNPISTFDYPCGFTFDGTFVYLAIRGGDRIVRIRVSTGAVTLFALEDGLSPCKLSYDGTYIYALSENSDRLTRIKTTDLSDVQTITLPQSFSPNGFTFDGTYLYAFDYLGKIARLRAGGSLTLENNFFQIDQTGTQNATSAMIFDGTYLYAANAGKNNVIRFLP